eukprot:EW704628.1.p1 GENE.EW704628.1~~EW704628.1.p1  ORF type:complete len:103 (+),score=43.93 EW704628.1:68-376(+)
MARVGGVGDAKAATAEVQAIVTELHGAVQGKVGELKGAKAGEAVSFATQVVAGVNYFIKAKYSVGGKDTFAHLRVWKKLGNGGLELTNVQYPKAEADAIAHF